MAKAKKFEAVYGEYDLERSPLRPWIVVFEDENGRSTLAKCKTEAQADKRIARFEAVRKAGKLLRPDKSAWL